jgi:hypothetical protein
MKILVGDISESMADFVNRFLGPRYCSLGRGVSVTRRGAAADILYAAGKESFDLVILTVDNVVYDTGAGHEGCALGLIRRLRALHDIPVIATGRCALGADFAGRALTAGADFFFEAPMSILDFGNAVEELTRGPYAYAPLERGDIPWAVRELVEHWDEIAFCAREGYEKLGRVAVVIAQDGDNPEGARLTAVRYACEEGRPDEDVARLIASYDPEYEAVVRFVDVMKRPRALRLKTRPGRAHPKRVWFFEMLKKMADRPDEVRLEHLPGWFAEALRPRAGEWGHRSDSQEEGGTDGKASEEGKWDGLRLSRRGGG